MTTSRSESRKKNDQWGNGFVWGFVIALIIVLCFIYGQRNAYAATPKNPPKYWIETALKIGRCEQPSGRPGKWASINWKNESNYSFKGGLGMTNLLWDTHKRRGYPEDANQATPMQQIITAWRFYRWAEATYPNYGYTGWECSDMIGFHGFTRNGRWK